METPKVKAEFDQADYDALLKHYYEPIVQHNVELPGGRTLRRQTSPPRIEQDSPGFKALRKKLEGLKKSNTPDSVNQIYQLLRELNKWQTRPPSLGGALPSWQRGSAEDGVAETIDLTAENNSIDVDSYIIDVLLVGVLRPKPDPDGGAPRMVAASEPAPFVKREADGGDQSGAETDNYDAATLVASEDEEPRPRAADNATTPTPAPAPSSLAPDDRDDSDDDDVVFLGTQTEAERTEAAQLRGEVRQLDEDSSEGDSESGPRCHAVYLVPRWPEDDYNIKLLGEEKDDDDYEWGHRGYALVGPFGVYEARADADRLAQDVSRHVAAVLNGSDGLDSSWVLSRALPVGCVARVRSFGSEADFELRKLDRAFHTKLRATMTAMLKPERAAYLEKIRKHLSASRPSAIYGAQCVFRVELPKAGFSADDPAAPAAFEEWVCSQPLGRDLARVLGHDKEFKCKKKYDGDYSIWWRGAYPLIEVRIQSIDAPPGAGATLYAMVGRHELCSNGDYYYNGGDILMPVDDVSRKSILGLAWEPGDVSTALVRHVGEKLSDLEIIYKDDTEQSRWKTAADDDFGFYEEPVDSSVLFADAPLPRARVFREAVRIHDDSGAFKGLQTREAGTVAMPAAPVHNAPRDDQYFIHATRLDEAGSPVARGYVVSEQEHQTCVDNFIMWPEAVPFHRARPAS